MYRACKAGGQFLPATDLGGTPCHPCNIQRDELDRFLADKRFHVIEQDCGTHLPSSPPPSDLISLYVFRGRKTMPH